MVGSQAAYARHRKERGLIGGTRHAVQKALASRRITAGSDGLIDFDRADRDWERNLNHRKRPAARAQQTAQAKPAAAPATAPEPEPEEGDQSFLEAQRRHEWLKVEKEDLVLRVRRGELFERTEAKEEWGKLLTTFRGRMMLLPDKLAPRVAVLGDVLECRVLIEREVREALSALSEYQPDAA